MGAVGSIPEAFFEYSQRQILIDVVANGCATGWSMLTDSSAPVRLALTDKPDFLTLR